MTSVPPTRPPAAPETDVRLLTEAESEVLADAFVAANRAEFMDTDFDVPILRALERIVAERVRVVKGERDDLASRIACVMEASYWDRGYDERIAAIRGMCDLDTNGMMPEGVDWKARAESAEAAHRALQAAVEALADECDRRCEHSEDRVLRFWTGRLRALVAGGEAR